MDPIEENRLRELLLELYSSERDDILSGDSGEEDNLDIRDHQTNSEQSEDDTSDPPNEVKHQNPLSLCMYDVRRNTNFILGKDGITEWYPCRPPLPRNARQRPHNILRIHLPGPRGDACNANTHIDCWNLFFNQHLIETIVQYTNQKIEVKRQNYTRDRDAKDTDIIEIKALLVLYMAGTLKSSHENLDDLYTTDFTGVEFFRSTMSLRRLRFLLGSLRFDDAATREERRQVNKLAPIRQIFEHFNQNYISNYTLGENCTIDEMLEPFRGRCPFRKYIKTKPARYGIKVYALADSKTCYGSNMEVYCGKQQPQDPFNISNKAKYVVLRLVQPISQSGRNVTVDNFFSSIPLCDEMARVHKLSIVGTVRKNKRELPDIVQVTTNRPVHSSLFLFGNDKTLVSYKPKEKKIVFLLSSLHNSDVIDPESGDSLKPEILTFYNKNKGGMDTLDKLKASYNVGRKTNRWPLSLFYALLNIGGVNANIIYLSNSQENIPRRHFLKSLARDLCKDHVTRRAQQENLPRLLKLQMRKLAGIEEEERRPRPVGASGRCEYCTWRENRKTVVSCSYVQGSSASSTPLHYVIAVLLTETLKTLQRTTKSKIYL